MSEVRFEGIVIGREDWGDTDRVILFYTPEFGKLEAVARGVRYEKSKLKGHLELLTRGLFSVVSGRSRAVLTDAASLQTYPLLRVEPALAWLGAIFVHLYEVNTFPGMDDQQLWTLLCTELEALDGAPVEREMLEQRLLGFLRHFLTCLGYGDHSLPGQWRALDALWRRVELAGPQPSALAGALGFLVEKSGIAK